MASSPVLTPRAHSVRGADRSSGSGLWTGPRSRPTAPSAAGDVSRDRIDRLDLAAVALPQPRVQDHDDMGVERGVHVVGSATRSRGHGRGAKVVVAGSTGAGPVARGPVGA